MQNQINSDMLNVYSRGGEDRNGIALKNVKKTNMTGSNKKTFDSLSLLKYHASDGYSAACVICVTLQVPIKC